MFLTDAALAGLCCVSWALSKGILAPSGWSEPLEVKHEDSQEGSSGSSTLTSMRHSRSLPSLASADLTTPRNLIEVSAWMRQQHDHHDGHRPAGKGSLSSGKASAASNKGCPPLGKALSGKSLSGRGSALTSRASSVPSIANSRDSGQSFHRQVLPEQSAHPAPCWGPILQALHSGIMVTSFIRGRVPR